MKDSLDVAQWKLHLNVGIDSINEVSKYLKESNFHHKLLSGGEIEDGKIFTIYIGSYKITKELANKIFAEIGGHLCKPTKHNEIEFEAGVVGRFEYESNNGSCGFYLNPNYKSLTLKEQELKSYRELKSKFGKYFHESPPRKEKFFP